MPDKLGLGEILEVLSDLKGSITENQRDFLWELWNLEALKQSGHMCQCVCLLQMPESPQILGRLKDGNSGAARHKRDQKLAASDSCG